MTATAPEQARTVLERFPAGDPRGSWRAEEHAAAQRAQCTNATSLSSCWSQPCGPPALAAAATVPNPDRGPQVAAWPG
ncbi:hypothetical protein ACFWV1_31355 [Streptomyces sp. NPDC058700]|uniref:hypothetical protein n=1 Tax=Streptomyces sp. NPDC058700 TaxID=3346607 RepID=UPI00365F0224